MDVLTSILWATEIWNSCLADVVKNCFDHRLKVGTEKIAEKIGISERDTVNRMVRDAMEHGMESTRAGLKSMLTPNDEDFVTEEILLEQLRWEAASVCGTEDEDVVTEDLGDGEDFSVAKELAVLAHARSIFERRGKLCDGSRSVFSRC